MVVPAAQAGRVPWSQPVRLYAVRGTFLTVAVTAADTAAPVVGSVSPDGLSWVSAAALVPLTRYTVTADLVDARQRVVRRSLEVRATDTDRHLTATVSPGDKDTVGVGMPVVVVFNTDVPSAQRPAVQGRLGVTSTPAVDGSWHWISGHEVHWRPQVYWPAGTQVTVHTDLTHFDLGGGLWGRGQHTADFTIGDAHISTADVAAHTFTVTSNGQTLRAIPMSAGRDVFPTKNGAHIVLEKAQVVTMDSQTVGIPRNSPDGYFEKVFWDVRISNGGAFVHAAPWSANDQGHRNVSHGCVNISTADAQWFYGIARRGDIVNVVNSPAPPDRADPGMADWNISWNAWLAGAA